MKIAIEAVGKLTGTELEEWLYEKLYYTSVYTLYTFPLIF